MKKVKDICKLVLSPTLFHEWCHARVLKKGCIGQRVFIIHGISENERGKKLTEDYFRESKDYINTEILEFSLYQRIDKKNLSKGRADVDDRTQLREDLIINALKAPRRARIMISIISIIVSCYFVYRALVVDYWCVVPCIIGYYFAVFGGVTASSSYFGVKSDVYLIKHFEEYRDEVTYSM